MTKYSKAMQQTNSNSAGASVRDSARGFTYSVIKEKGRNTWTVKFKHRNRSGKIKWVTKRGFATKREALQYERDFLARKSGDKQYQQLQQFNSVKIGKYEIAKTTFLMCIRQSMKNYLAKLNDLVSFGGGVLFYGMWKGYMEQPEMKEFPDWMTSKGVKVHILHTSGHADSITIEKIVESTSPKTIIPVHTENADWFYKYEPSIIIAEYPTIEV